MTWRPALSAGEVWCRHKFSFRYCPSPKGDRNWELTGIREAATGGSQNLVRIYDRRKQVRSWRHSGGLVKCHGRLTTVFAEVRLLPTPKFLPLPSTWHKPSHRRAGQLVSHWKHLVVDIPDSHHQPTAHTRPGSKAGKAGPEPQGRGCSRSAFPSLLPWDWPAQALWHTPGKLKATEPTDPRAQPPATRTVCYHSQASEMS